MKVKTFFLGCLIGMFVALLIYAPISQTQTERQYDPWADMNDDGVIDILDVVKVTTIYGTTGDPAKSVIVNGYYTKEWNETVELSENESITYRVSTAGLKTLTLQVSIWPTVWFGTFPNQYGYANATIIVGGQILNRTVWSETKNLDAVIGGPTIVPLWPPPDQPFHYINTVTTFTRVYSLACSSVELLIYARSPIECNVRFYITA